MRTLTHLTHLLLMWVKSLMHFLQSSQDLAWLISLLLTSLVILFPVWLVALTPPLLTLLFLLVLTHLFTPGQDIIGLHLKTTLLRMITRSQGTKLLRISKFLLVWMIDDKGGEDLD
jgi:hypothetical protein